MAIEIGTFTTAHTLRVSPGIARGSVVSGGLPQRKNPPLTSALTAESRCPADAAASQDQDALRQAEGRQGLGEKRTERGDHPGQGPDTFREVHLYFDGSSEPMSHVGDLSGHAGAALRVASSRSALRMDRRSQIYRFTIHALGALPVPPLAVRWSGNLNSVETVPDANTALRLFLACLSWHPPVLPQEVAARGWRAVKVIRRPSRAFAAQVNGEPKYFSESSRLR